MIRSGKFSEHLLPISNPSQFNELIIIDISVLTRGFLLFCICEYAAKTI